MDAVFTWVDGGSPEFLTNKALHAARWSFGTPPGWETRSSYTGLAEAKERSIPASHSQSRFRDKGELRFALRAISKFAPWIQRIYIITNGQIPAWLDLSNPRVAIVTHEQLFEDASCLPTFNSNAIESTMHRIPGLSENFIYFNDDFFIGRPVTPADFIDSQGRHRLLVEQNRKIPRDMTDRSMIAHSWAFNNALLNDRIGKSTSRLMFAHTPQIYNKHVLAEIQLVWREHFERTRRNRFRTAFDAAFRILYTYYVGEGKRALVSQNDTKSFGILSGIDDKTYSFIKVGDPNTDYRTAMDRVRTSPPAFFCVNDEIPDHATLREEQAIARLTRGFLLEFYPERSAFELANAGMDGSSLPAAAQQVQVNYKCAARIMPGVKLGISSTGFTPSVGEGWHVAEETGIWSNGPHATLCLQVDPRTWSEGFLIEITARVFGSAEPGGRLLRLSVQLGRDRAWTHTSEFRLTSDDLVSLRLPTPSVPSDWRGEIVLTFDRLIAPRPQELGVSSDARSLGTYLCSVRVLDGYSVGHVAADVA